MEIISGKITDFGQDGSIIIRASLPSIDRACLRRYCSVEIGLPDGRYITPEQRKKAYALINEIADWSGDLPENIKKLLKMEFIVHRLQAINKTVFSLANCDVTTAKEFISYLIEFVLDNHVPVREPLYELCEDIDRYTYACLMSKSCCICGKKADLHHWTAVGRRDRKNIYQIGMLVMPLCREHHELFHQIGVNDFKQRYHINPIPLTKEIGKVYRLTKKNIEGGDNGSN